jgi:streptogramin lyase
LIKPATPGRYPVRPGHLKEQRMTLARKILFSLAVAACSVLTGCSAKSTSPSPPAAPSFVYYATSDGFTLGSPQMGIVAYPITASSTLATTLNASAANGLARTQNLAFDASGRLFVVNGHAPFTISVFTPPLTATSAASFVLTIPAGLLVCMFGIAVDASGNLWISNCSTSVFEFNGPFTTSETLPAPNVTLTSPLATAGLAFDASGNLWVALDQATNGIEEYLKGTGFTNSTPVDHTITGLATPVTLAFDKSGDLFSSGSAQGAAEYLASNLASGATPNVLNPTGLASGFFAEQFTFDAVGNLYVADCGSTAKIYVYPTATQVFSSTLAPITYSDANILASKCVEGIAIR